MGKKDEKKERMWEAKNRRLRRENDDLIADLRSLRRPRWLGYLVETAIVIQTLLLAAALGHWWH